MEGLSHRCYSQGTAAFEHVLFLPWNQGAVSWSWVSTWPGKGRRDRAVFIEQPSLSLQICSVASHKHQSKPWLCTSPRGYPRKLPAGHYVQW